MSFRLTYCHIECMMELWLPKIPSARIRVVRQIRASSHSMLAILRLLATFVADLFKSRRRLEAEILFLRHQLNIALRHRPARLPLRGSDRAAGMDDPAVADPARYGPCR